MGQSQGKGAESVYVNRHSSSASEELQEGGVVKYLDPQTQNWQFGWVEFPREKPLTPSEAHTRIWRIGPLPPKYQESQLQGAEPLVPLKLTSKETMALMNFEEGELHALCAGELKGVSVRTGTQNCDMRYIALEDMRIFRGGATSEASQMRSTSHIGMLTDDVFLTRNATLSRKSPKVPFSIEWRDLDSRDPIRFKNPQLEANPICGGCISSDVIIGAINAVVTCLPPKQFDELICLKQNIRTFQSFSSSQFDNSGNLLFFKVYTMGAWQYIPVDRRQLPYTPEEMAGKNEHNPSNSPTHAHLLSSQGDLWPAFLEKAIARMYGAYDILHYPINKNPQKLMVLLSGGIPTPVVCTDALSAIAEKELLSYFARLKNYLAKKTGFITARCRTNRFDLSPQIYQLVSILSANEQDKIGKHMTANALHSLRGAVVKLRQAYNKNVSKENRLILLQGTPEDRRIHGTDNPTQIDAFASPTLNTDIYLHPAMFLRHFETIQAVTTGPDFLENGEVATDYREQQLVAKLKRGVHYATDMEWWPSEINKSRYIKSPQVALDFTKGKGERDFVISAELETRFVQGCADLRMNPVRCCVDLWRLYPLNSAGQPIKPSTGRRGSTPKTSLTLSEPDTKDCTYPTVGQAVKHELLETIGHLVSENHYNFDRGNGDLCTWTYNGVPAGKYVLVLHVTHVTVQPAQLLPPDINVSLRLFTGGSAPPAELDILEPDWCVFMEDGDSDAASSDSSEE